MLFRLVVLFALSVMASVAAPRAILWQAPSVSRIRSLGHGPGGNSNHPKPPFRFLKEESGGTAPKLWVADAKGRKWIVKWGREVHADTFATRLAWAMGYNAAPVYFVRKGVIVNARGLKRAADHVSAKGVFADARFKLVDESMTYIEDGWRWDKNPFVTSPQGRRELNGLKILMMLLANWDGKDSRHHNGANTAIFRRTNADYYVMDDWGASMGEWGHYFSRKRWSCEGFREQDPDFVKGVDEKGFVEWGFHGTSEKDLRKEITLADIRWFNRYLGQLRDADLLNGLRASGASESESRCYVRALRTRISTLQKLVSPPRRLAKR